MGKHRLASVSTRVQRAARAFGRVVRLMAILRSPQGCPWDREQTHDSLRPFLLEESYELLEAVERRDDAALVEELGDVLFQCVFHAQLAAETGRFEIADAANTIAGKLIRRHPHVFTRSGRPISQARRQKKGLRSPDAVLEQWERLKAREKADAGTSRRVLAGVPRSMPALLRAVCEAEHWECGRYFEPDGNTNALRFQEAWWVPDPAVGHFVEETRALRFPPGVGLVGRAWQSGTPLWATDIASDARTLKTAVALRAGMRGLFAVPVAAESIRSRVSLPSARVSLMIGMAKV